MVGLLTFDNDAGTKAGTYRNQTLDKKGKLMFLWVFFESKWRRDRDSNPGRLLHLAGFQDQCIQPLCHPSNDANDDELQAISQHISLCVVT